MEIIYGGSILKV